MSKEKILIIQTAFIGDVILATSLVEHIKNVSPDSQVDFFLRKGNESLIETHPGVSKIYVWNKSEGKYRSLFKLIRQVRKEKYTAVLNIQRFFNSGLVTALSGAKTKIGFKQNPLSIFFSKKIEHKIPHSFKNEFLHEVQRNLQLYQKLRDDHSFVEKQSLKPKLYFNATDEETIKNLDIEKPYFVLAPSSVWFTKQWQLEKWKELIALLPKDHITFLIGAPSDADTIAPLLGPDNVKSLLGKLSLRQSALLMKNAKRVFVNDSAPLHLASSVNANTTAIFCSTTPAFGYFPLSDNSVVVEAETELSCKPCGLHGHKQCPKNHFKCSALIEASTVLNTVS